MGANFSALFPVSTTFCPLAEPAAAPAGEAAPEWEAAALPGVLDGAALEAAGELLPPQPAMPSAAVKIPAVR